MPKNILGISAFYHDSAAAILHDGRLLAAAQEERFTRKKHDEAFPVNAIRYCLEEAGLTIDELDAVVFYDKPFLKFERLLQTYYAFAPKGIRSFIAAMPIWLTKKIFLKQAIRKGLKEVATPYTETPTTTQAERNQSQPRTPTTRRTERSRSPKLLFPEHHLSHAASAFYPSPYQKAAILTIDGVGEWATASIGLGEGKEIKVLRELHFPHSVGLLYSAFTYFLGFKVNNGEYKLMGLAPYGRKGSDAVKTYVETIKKELIDLKADGSIHLHQKYFNYATGLRMIKENAWEQLFGIPKRDLDSPLAQVHCDLAMAIQEVTEEIVCRMAKTAKTLTGADYLCLAGGVALNCVANGKLRKLGIFKDIYIQAAAGDAGGALGAALAAQYLYFGEERQVESPDAMQGAYLGPQYSGLEIERMARANQAVFTRFETVEELCATVAAKLANGKTCGWFQGRMEYGPRALGGRSILADPRSAEMQKKLNIDIKFRESFRPFAPAVLAEDVGEYFDFEGHSPYMLLVDQIKDKQRKPVPKGYQGLPMMEKLYVQRSNLPAITHVDFSARIQTVHRETNPRFYDLLAQFKAKTGCSVLVNTSFNVRGEPIVCTPQEAYACFMQTGMDLLAIGNYLFEKNKMS